MRILIFCLLSIPLLSQELTVDCVFESPDSITTVVSGGIAPYSYMWSDSDTTEHRGNLSAGTYIVTVVDATNCYNVCGVDIPGAPCNIIIEETIAKDTCGNSLGSIDLNVSGGSASYSFFWNTGDTIEDIFNIPAGSYTVQVIDSMYNACDTTKTIVVPDTSITILIPFVVTESDCDNGDIDISPTPVRDDYSFVWSNGFLGEDLIDVGEGFYEVDVSYGTCLADTIIEMTADTVFDVSCIIVTPNTISVTPIDGTEPVTYLWSDANTEQTRDSLVPGLYQVTATDADGCVAECEILLLGSDTCFNRQPVINLTFDQNCLNDTITITASPDTGAYVPAWSSTSTIQGDTNLWSIKILSTAEEQIEATLTLSDDTCSFFYNIVFGSINCCACVLTDIDTTLCYGDSIAMALDTTSCLGPLTYAWSNGDTVENPMVYMGGNYELTLTDADGCSTVGYYKVQTLIAPIVNIEGALSLCNGQTSMLTAIGEVDSVLWSTGDTVASITIDTAGTYTVTSYGAGCNSIASVDVTFFSDNSIDLGVDTTNCDQVLLDPGYSGTYLWSTGAINNKIIVNQTGLYKVTITDINGCEAVDSINVTINMHPYFGIVSSSSCDSTVLSTGQVGDHAWSTGDSTSTTTVLSSGFYDVTVTDANACTRVQTIDVTIYDTDILSLPDTILACSGEEVTINTGLSSEFEFYWFRHPLGFFGPNLGSDSFFVTSGLNDETIRAGVIDTNGCIKIHDVVIDRSIPDVQLFAFEDFNGDGRRNSATQSYCLDTTYTDVGLEGVLFEVYNVDGSLRSYGNTDSNGFYTPSLEEGFYTMRVYSGIYEISPQNKGVDTIDSDFPITETYSEIPFVLVGCDAAIRYDVGLYEKATISDYVWLDVDEDGIQDIGESGEGLVEIELIGEAQTNSDVFGAYAFVVDPGQYEIRIDLSGYLASPMDQGADDELDSDIMNGGETEQFWALSGESLTCWDFGLIEDCGCVIDTFYQSAPCEFAWEVTGNNCRAEIRNSFNEVVSVADKNGLYTIYVYNGSKLCESDTATISGCITYDICWEKVIIGDLDSGETFTIRWNLINDKPYDATGVGFGFDYNGSQTYISSSPTASNHRTNFGRWGGIGGGFIGWENQTIPANNTLTLEADLSQDDNDNSLIRGFYLSSDKPIVVESGGSCQSSGF